MTASSASTYTPQQERAIQFRDGAVSLAAGAGCGKTFVLTERFLAELYSGPSGREWATELDELLAITFTDAAAREMRDRIRQKCYEKLLSAPASREEHWLRLLRQLDSARISTIHSFCTSLLRSHAVELGLDPNFQVLPQGDAEVLLSRVIDDVFRRALAERDEQILDLAAAFDLRPLREHVTSLVSKWSDRVSAEWCRVSADEVLYRWESVQNEQVAPILVKKLVASASARQIVSLLRPVAPTNERFADARSELLRALDLKENRDAGSPEGSPQDSHLGRLLDSIEHHARVRGVCKKQDWASPQDFETYKNACTKLRDKARKEAEAATPIDRDLALPAAQQGLDLLHLAGRVRTEYARLKTELGLLDFDDLLGHAHILLTSSDYSEARKGLASGLHRVLVDEFQDTDQLQVDLVLALCGEAPHLEKLFFVGDFKQSIYRFRGAQPEVFHRLRSQVGSAGHLPLTVNFRSQPAILHFVNALFCDVFEEYEPLLPHLQQTTPEPCIELLWTISPNKNRKQRGDADAARRQEARRIAHRLRKLLDAGEPLVVDRAGTAAQTGAPSARPLRLGDVAILFRALSDVRHYEEALRDYGLDYYLVGGHGYYAQQEIYDVLNLLRCVSSSCDEISLAGTLRSPFFGLSDEAMFWLVEHSGSLNAALEVGIVPLELEAHDLVKMRRAWEVLGELRSRKDSLSIAEVLLLTLDRTGYDAVLCTEFLGERKLANLQKLLEQARAADRSGLLDLNGFITQLSEFVAREPKEAPAATCPESADVIRLMTIHHAKGLEFPLVVVPDLDKSAGGGYPRATLHAELGPVVKHPNYDGTSGASLHRILDAAAEAEERMRLLYVACTRAADYLILSSSLTDHEKPGSDWMQLLAKRFDLQTGVLKESLPEGYETPSVRVPSEELATEDLPVDSSRRPSLAELIADAQRLATSGAGTRPAEVAVVEPDLAARREFSFSRLTGELADLDEFDHLETDVENPAGFPPAPFPEMAPPVDASAGDTLAEEAVVDPLGLGLLVHDVMQRLEFGAENPLAEWCRTLAENYCPLEAQQAGNLGLEMVSRFGNSQRARAMAIASQVHRELEFLLPWPPTTAVVDPLSAKLQGEGFYLRGFVDCLYQSVDGSWHIIDYKTNDILPDAVADAASRYELQLGVYSLAVEQATGGSPSELVLHFLRPGVEHLFSWGDPQRRKVIEQVSRALLRYTGRSVDAAS